MIVVLVVTFSICSWFAATGYAWRIENDAIENAFNEAQAVTQLLVADWQTKQTQIVALQRIGAIISHEVLDHRATNVAMAQLHQMMIEAGPDVLQVGAIDADGLMLWSSLPMPATPVDLSKTEHFTSIAVDGRDTFIGRLVIGHLTHQWTVQMSYAVRGDDRALQAVVVVSVDVTILTRLAKSLGIDGRGVLMIMRDDGQMLMRSLPLPAGQIDSLADTNMRKALLTRSAHFRDVSLLDGVARFYVRQLVPNSNVLAAVGLDESAVLHGARATSYLIWAMTSALNIAWYIATAAVMLAIKRTRMMNIEKMRNLAVSERHLLMQEFADMATDAIAILDHDLRFLYVNQVVARAHGAAFSNLLGLRFGEQVMPEDEQLVVQAIESLKRTTQSQRLIWRMRLADGSIGWWESEIVGFNLDDRQDNQSRRYISITRDITARKLAEAALLQAHEHISVMLRESRGILLRDSFHIDAPMELRVMVGSPSSIGSLNLADSDSRDVLIANLDDESMTRLQNTREKCRAEGHAVAELRYQAKGEDVQWLRLQSTRLAATSEDVELLHLLTDITAEHQQRQIQQQTERLAVIGEVCAGIAHEVNQPLAVISMAASNALRELKSIPGDGERVASKLRRIETQAVRVGKIISHIRGFGRMELANREAFSAVELIETGIILAQGRLTGAGVAALACVAPDMPEIFSVRAVLEQVLMNLIVNACDAYAERHAADDSATSPQIWVSAEAKGGGCVIRVADQAGGIADDVIDHIFTPFFTTKAADKGTGLGLSFCANSVRELGGQITAYNQHGGAVFEIELPAEACVAGRVMARSSESNLRSDQDGTARLDRR